MLAYEICFFMPLSFICEKRQTLYNFWVSQWIKQIDGLQSVQCNPPCNDILIGVVNYDCDLYYSPTPGFDMKDSQTINPALVKIMAWTNAV